MAYQHRVPIEESACFDLLIASCSSEWQLGAVIVANSMHEGDAQHSVVIGDLALEERLRTLVEAGRVEIDDADLPYGKYSVRLSKTG